MPEVFDKLLKPEEIADCGGLPQRGQRARLLPSLRNMRSTPHHAINLPGLHAYAQKSIAAGDEIEFRVSSTVPYDLSVVKLGSDPENRDKDPVLQSFQVEQPQAQPIHPGSYLHVAKALPVERRLVAVDLGVLDSPVSVGWLAGLGHPARLSGALWRSGCSSARGKIVFGTGSGGAYDAAAFQQTKPGLIKAHRWHHLVGSWDGKNKRIYLDGKLVAEAAFAGTARPGKTALRLGAYGQEGKAVNFYQRRPRDVRHLRPGAH